MSPKPVTANSGRVAAEATTAGSESVEPQDGANTRREATARALRSHQRHEARPTTIATPTSRTITSGHHIAPPADARSMPMKKPAKPSPAARASGRSRRSTADQRVVRLSFVSPRGQRDQHDGQQGKHDAAQSRQATQLHRRLSPRARAGRRRSMPRAARRRPSSRAPAPGRRSPGRQHPTPRDRRPERTTRRRWACLAAQHERQRGQYEADALAGQDRGDDARVARHESAAEVAGTPRQSGEQAEDRPWTDQRSSAGQSGVGSRRRLGGLRRARGCRAVAVGARVAARRPANRFGQGGARPDGQRLNGVRRTRRPGQARRARSARGSSTTLSASSSYRSEVVR